MKYKGGFIVKSNQKGFTVIELLASFTLTMIIVVFLFEIVLELKDVYVNNSLKTRVIDKNALIATNINTKLSKKYISAASCASNRCTVTYLDGSSDQITVEPDGVTIGTKQKIAMPEGAEIENAILTASTVTLVAADPNVDNSYLQISYIVTGGNLNEDVSFNYVYTYH